MTNTPQPARQRKGQLITLAILVTVLAVPIVAGWINTATCALLVTCQVIGYDDSTRVRCVQTQTE